MLSQLISETVPDVGRYLKSAANRESEGIWSRLCPPGLFSLGLSGGLFAHRPHSSSFISQLANSVTLAALKRSLSFLLQKLCGLSPFFLVGLHLGRSIR